MTLPELAHKIRKSLSPKETKMAAEDYGLTHFYFTQKIKSVDTNDDDLLKAVECLLKVHNDKNEKIQNLYNQFLEVYKNNNSNPKI